MKTMKKMLSVVLAVMLTLALAIPAFAAGGETGTITITPPDGATTTATHTYTAYKMFDLRYAEGAYAYTVNEDWTAFFTGEGAGAKYVTISAYDNTVTIKEGANLPELAKDALAFTKTAPIAATGIAQSVNGGNAVFEGLPYGYYLIDSSMGVLCALDTNAPNVNIQEKNTEPTIEKKVEQPSASVGDTIKFTTTVKIPNTATGKYVIHDTMTGLKYNKDVKIMKGDRDITNLAKVTLTEQGFDITFADVTDVLDPVNTDAIGKDASVTTLTITYTATVLDSAIQSNGLNKTWIEYDDNQATTPSETTTYNYDFNLYKITMKDGQEVLLNNAQFQLHKDNENGDLVKFEKKEDGYHVAQDGTVDTITAGNVKIMGLAEGTYYLVETQAPEGYNKLANPIKIEIVDNDGNGNYDGNYVVKMNDQLVNTTEEDSVIPQIKVQNNTGSELPHTGGVGTTMFYVVGGVLMAGAVVFLMTKKKMH